MENTAEAQTKYTKITILLQSKTELLSQPPVTSEQLGRESSCKAQSTRPNVVSAAKN